MSSPAGSRYRPHKSASASPCSCRSRPATIRRNGSTGSRMWPAHAEVMEFYRMAGDVDYMLRVVVTDIAGYDYVLQEADRHGAAEERDVAIRDGADQIDDGAADP